MRGRAIALLALLTLLFSARAARADEIRLKDGTKIIGTIVGFENDSFRVETAYGFALVKKDKVADINITATPATPKTDSKKDLESKKPSEADRKLPADRSSDFNSAREPEASSINAPPVASVASTSSTSGTTSPVAKQPALLGSDAMRLKVPQPAPLRIPGISPATVKIDSGAKPKIVDLTPPPLAVPAPPQPLVIRDEIRGNIYANLTYGFQMYKPPSWDLIPAARKALPDAVAALGTYDQTTLLVIGREHAKDSLDAHATATGKALGDVYENYRLISTKHVSIAGFPAVEQRARGTADGRDWSVLLLTFLKGTDAYTLLGMTWANSDLIQVQENVISKTVNSLTFATN